MGNEQQVVSRFADQGLWMPLAQTNRKQLIQNKISREVVEKHFLRNLQWDEVRQDGIIYQWRQEPEVGAVCVELLEVRQLTSEDDANCFTACENGQVETDLLVYTEHIFKLYEQNPKCVLTEREQCAIFKGIIEGIALLSQKFGEFAVTKDMIGYNAKKVGKAWLNQNFCINKPQNRRSVRNGEDRLKWEKQIIETLLSVSKLCSIDRNIKSCKFSIVMEIISKQRLYQFEAFRNFGIFRDIQVNRGFKKQQARMSYEEVTSGRKSGELLSTEDRNRENQRRAKIFSKTFEYPVIKIYEPDRNMTTLDARPQTGHPQHNITLGGPKREVPRPIRPHPTVHRGSNPSHVPSINYSPMFPPSVSQSFLYDANDFNNRQYKNHNNTSQYPSYLHPRQPSYQSPQKYQKPQANYRLLQQLQQSRSSRPSSKMMPKQMIKMVDSWMVIERKDDDHSSKNGGNMLLEESFIVKMPPRR